jgi:hypothetical protein
MRSDNEKGVGLLCKISQVGCCWMGDGLQARSICRAPLYSFPSWTTKREKFFFFERKERERKKPLRIRIRFLYIWHNNARHWSTLRDPTRWLCYPPACECVCSATFFFFPCYLIRVLTRHMQNSYLWAAYNSYTQKTRIASPHGIFVAVNYTDTEFVDDPIHIFFPPKHITIMKIQNGYGNNNKNKFTK